jgi:hypothetical protein
LDSWEVFKLAAQHDDAKLATAAVKRFEADGHTHRSIFVDNPERFFLVGLPPKYATALVRSAFSIDSGTKYSRAGNVTSWYVWNPTEMHEMVERFELPSTEASSE